MTTEDVLETYFRCLDTEDWTLMRTVWHEDAEMQAVGSRRRSGLEEILEFLSTLFAAWPVHEDRPTRIITAGTTSTVEVTFTGTTRDGRQVSFDAVVVFDIEEGRIRRLSNWYDIAHVRRVLAAGEDTPAGSPPHPSADLA
jgi:ketosteroid isomerase-like protein